MGFENKYPYTDFHELNLDWILEQMKSLAAAWDAYQEELTGTNGEWPTFKNYIETSWATYQNNLTGPTGEWPTFKAAMEQAWADYQEDLTGVGGEWPTFKATMEGEWQQFFDTYLQTLGVVQTTGSSITDVMSQKAVTDELNKNVKWSEFYVDFTTYDGWFLTTSNTWTANAAFAVSDPIPVYEGLTLHYIHGARNTYIMCIGFSNGEIGGDGKYIIQSGYIETGTSGTASDPIDVIVPSDAKYCFICIQKSFETSTSVHFYMYPSQLCKSIYDVSKLPIPDNSVTTQKIADNAVDSNKIADESITQYKTDFVETVTGNNKLDESTMIIVGKMYYIDPITPGDDVQIIENEYTARYGAFKIDVRNQSNIVLSLSENPGNDQRMYCCYFVDSNDKIITGTNGYIGYITTSGLSISIPNDTAYIMFNVTLYTDKANANYMCSYGSVALPYEPYESYHTYFGERYEIVTTKNVAKLEVPDSYDVVVGDTFELFYKGIINAVNSDILYTEIICNKGKGFKKRFIFTPTISDVGAVTMNIKLYDFNHVLLDSATVNLNVIDKGTSPGSSKNVLFIGDSLSSSGAIPKEFDRRLTGTGGSPAGDELTNIKFIGTCTNGSTGYEAYGGYNFTSYNTENKLNSFMWITCTGHDKNEADDQHSLYTDSLGQYWKLETIEANRIKIICTNISGSLPSNTGTLTWYSGGINHSNIVYTDAEQAAGNPFWNDLSNKVDFTSYITSLGESSLDYVYVLLGWNESSNEASVKSSVRTFLDNILTDYPSCKIVLCGIELPSYDGLANNYGNDEIDWLPYGAYQKVFDLNKWYKEISEENAYNANVNFINIAGQFDTEHNMITGTRTVNTRNPETETYQTNGVHPDIYGSYQIADACWRDFQAKLQ